MTTTTQLLIQHTPSSSSTLAATSSKDRPQHRLAFPSLHLVLPSGHDPRPTSTLVKWLLFIERSWRSSDPCANL